MAAEQITAKQHYVPTFYLKQFADATGFLQILDAKEARLGKARPYKGVCYEQFFYGVETGKEDEISQAFEQAFGAMETQFADRMPAAIQRLRDGNASEADFDMLAYFMSLQWQRTGYFRRQINHMQDQMTRHIMSFAASNPDHIRKVLKRAGHAGTDEEVQQVCGTFSSGSYALNFNNSAHLRFMGADTLSGFRNLFFYKRWRIIRARGAYHFITTDNPVAEWIPEMGIYGAGFVQRTHYLALTPDLLIECTEPAQDGDPLNQPVLQRVVYVDADDDESQMFNIVLVAHCERFCYAQRRSELEALMALRGASGRPMTLYLERYWSKQAHPPRQ